MIDTAPIYGADLVCDKCQHFADIFDWYFDCGSHGFKKASRQGIINGMLIMCQTS